MDWRVCRHSGCSKRRLQFAGAGGVSALQEQLNGRLAVGHNQLCRQILMVAVLECAEW